jgi:hypothetical protein
MSELPGDPDDAEELIAGQYSDRPQLRPVLEAVLAALPALGPVAVQSRKTLVSLSTPRRVFAVVQPTTRSRVDLGLRLEHERPGGRLLAARDLGATTVRIPLTRPGEVDAEVVGWLRRAYQENAVPPPPRSPARRQAPQFRSLTVVIEASGMPGRSWPPGETAEHGNLHIALCIENKERPALVVPGKPWLALDSVPGDSPSARWEAAVTVRRDADGLDFSGPYVRGDRTDRNLFLAWGEAKWGYVMDVWHIDRLRRARDLLSVKGYDMAATVLACYSGAGFSEALMSRAAADPRILLVGLDRLYG